MCESVYVCLYMCVKMHVCVHTCVYRFNFVAIKVCYHVLVVIFGAFHLVRMQFYMLSGPTHPLFACNTQWKRIGGLRPPPPPRSVRN